MSVLGTALREPERPITTLPLLNPEERRHLIEDLNPQVSPKGEEGRRGIV